jgi:hypothetical protein
MTDSRARRAAWRFLVPAALLSVAAFIALAGVDARQLFADIDQDMAELSRISGLPVRHEVPSDMISRERINRYLNEKVKEEVKPEELRVEQTVLVKFGLVPPEFDMVKTTVDLLTEQAAAFYDFKAKKLFVSDWASSSMQQAALVHELAHALADQSFHLERFIKSAGKSDDGSLARMAVMEGQASWLMAEVMARRAGQSLANSPALVDQMSHASEAGDSQFPEFAKAPLYIRESLLFPYTAGMLFQHAVFVKLDRQAFTEVFRRPPLSSQQILHPQKYFDRVAPTAPAPPPLPAGNGFKKTAEGTVGELDFSVLLRQYAGKAEAGEVAPHWRGGVYQLWERKNDKRAVLAFSAEWDGEPVAGRFFDLYRKALERKWKRMKVTSSSPDLLEGVGDDGRFVLRRSGAVVTSLEGLAETPPAIN